MSLQVSEVPMAPQTVASDAISHCLADHCSSIWTDHFLSCVTNSKEIDEQTKQQGEQLKEEVRGMLTDAESDKPLRKLHVVDVVQRLGVSYHFKAEIDEALKQIHEKNEENDNQSDLYNVAVQFRLLRQQGYYVSCDVFNKMKDSRGKFKECLSSDVRGMLGVYEATHLRIHGEDVLDDALAFTTHHLQCQLQTQSNLSPTLAAQVSRALKQPLHKGIPRLEARHFISIYQEDPSRNQVLLAFAKIDFNVLQRMHQKELSDFTRWWTDLDFKNKLPLARDRVVECYFWILSVYYEPEYAQARRIVTKVITMISTIGDIYGVYGGIGDLELFSEAAEKWDIDAMNQLPEYMQVCYTSLLDVYVEIEEEMSCEGKSYRTYAKTAMKSLIRGYLQEAKWLNQQYTPTMDEYMSVGLVTTAYSTLATTSFIGMGDIVTKDAYEWLLTDPKIVRASSTVCRLMDDIVCNKFEQKGGNGASSIVCYMKQHGGTEKEVIEEFEKRVSDSWKDMNEECLVPTNVPIPLLTRILNFARLIDVFYKDDCYTNAEIFLKSFVTFLLVDPVSV